MAEVYPFPLPESIQEIAKFWLSQLDRRAGFAYFRENMDKSTPQFLEAYEACQANLAATEKALGFVLDAIQCRHTEPEFEGETCSLLALHAQLADEVGRMAALCEFVKMTWQYDPAIRNAPDPEPGKESAA